MGRLKKLEFQRHITWCESTAVTEGQGTCRKANNNHNYWVGIIIMP